MGTTIFTRPAKTRGMRSYPDILAARARLCDWEAAFLAGFREQLMPATDNMSMTRLGYRAGVRNRERATA